MAREKDYVVAKLESHGERFEILVKPKEAMDLRNGKSVSLSEAVVSDTIYKDVKKGLKASPSSLKKVFGTTDFETIAREIITKGEIPVTAQQRKEMLEAKKKQIIMFIARNTVDPKTNLPIPPSRIELAIEQARVSIDPNKDVEPQALQIIKELSKLIPIKLAKAILEVNIPAKYAKLQQQIQSMGEVKKTKWMPSGGLLVEMEIPAGSQTEVISKIGSLTKGEAEVKVVKVS